MNNSRNFTNEISNKKSFIELKEEINKKIKETLFDQNLLFLSSSFNYFCSTYNSGELSEEAKNISNLLDNLSNNNEEEKIENNYINYNSYNKETGIGDRELTESKKKSSESEDEKSSSFGSKFTKISQVEENKHKLYICLVKYPELIKLLDIKNDKQNGNGNRINLEEDNVKEYDGQQLKKKISQMENEIENNKNIKIKNIYLRKMVCLKLYKALHFALKNFELEEEQIKHICLYIEMQGRILDITMGIKYKEFIETILKRISADKILSN